LTNHGIDSKEYKPAYGGESAGLDLYYVGEETLFIVNNKMSTNGYDYKPVKIPTGIKIALPNNYVAKVFERGSILKTPFVSRAGVIDPGYTGDVFVTMSSLSDQPVYIRSGEKLPLQLVVMPFIANYKIVDEDIYNNLTKDSKRKDGAIGSSNHPREF
jgi:dUTPase